jgi:hypothetical protein
MNKTNRNNEIKKLIATNPQVDGNALSEVLNLIGNLRQNGIKGASYNLDAPFGRVQQKNHSGNNDTSPDKCTC